MAEGGLHNQVSRHLFMMWQEILEKNLIPATRVTDTEIKYKKKDKTTLLHVHCILGRQMDQIAAFLTAVGCFSNGAVKI